jgi:hypothetical protein
MIGAKLTSTKVAADIRNLLKTGGSVEHGKGVQWSSKKKSSLMGGIRLHFAAKPFAYGA